VWGLAVLKSAANPGNAIKFLQLLFSDRGVALQAEVGPTPTSPPIVSVKDVKSLPFALRSLVRAQR
jgi:ABC-type Fe3+ transport system substrate-binding protein